MSEGITIALIGLFGTILGGLISGFIGVIASGQKDKERGSFSCSVIGLISSIGAVIGLILGALFGVFLIQKTTSLQPTFISAVSSVAPSECSLDFLEYRDTRSSSPLENGFQASIGHNDNGIIKIFLSSQGETYRNYYQFTGNCSQEEKVELLKKEVPIIEANIRDQVSNFKFQEPIIVP